MTDDLDKFLREMGYADEESYLLGKLAEKEKLIRPPVTRDRKTWPRRKDNFWVNGRPGQPNGFIARINFPDREVVVLFHDGGGQETYSFDDLEGNWTDKMGGGYWLEYTQHVTQVDDPSLPECDPDTPDDGS